MSLDWKLNKIDNWEDKCYIDYDHENDECGKMKTETNQLIWITMIVGINEITEDNYQTFHSRLKMYEDLFGNFITNMDESNGRRYRALTEDVVKDHIGLWTNATRHSRQEFLRHIRDRWEDEQAPLK